MGTNLTRYQPRAEVLSAGLEPTAGPFVEGFFKFLSIGLTLALLAGLLLYVDADGIACKGVKSPDPRWICTTVAATCTTGPANCADNLLGNTATTKIPLRSLNWPGWHTKMIDWLIFVAIVAAALACNLVMYALGWFLLPWWISPVLWLPAAYYYYQKILLPRRTTRPVGPIRTINPLNRVGLESPLGEAGISSAWAADYALRGHSPASIDDLTFED
jgi:hypothetical protein